jgi:hypothetical protein
MADAQKGRWSLPCLLDKFESMLAAVTGLFFFAKYSND